MIVKVKYMWNWEFNQVKSTRLRTWLGSIIHPWVGMESIALCRMGCIRFQCCLWYCDIYFDRKI